MQVSVVLPYYENSRTLSACLTSLCRQTRPPREVIVVDDGSATPAKPVVDAQRWSVPVHLHVTEHRGQSGATNAGIAAAQSDLVLLSCADIIADVHLVQQHQDSHLAAPDEIAVVGRLPYAPNVKMTPFMQYMNTGDVQFSFERIENPEDVSPFYCYAPNFSVRRERLVDIGMFDEKFVYGYQDTDLGVRLAETGVRFVYRSQAIGWHDHPTTLRAFVQRQFRVGEATLYWLEKYQKQAEVRKMRLLVANYYPHIGELANHIAEAERMERAVTVRPNLLAAFKRDLFKQYALISAVGIVAGMAKTPARMYSLLGTHHDTVDSKLDSLGTGMIAP